MCEIEGIDTLGLDPTERRYMELLRQAQGPVRLNMIATQLALPKRTIEAVIESELIRLALITKNDEGRMLTAAGVKHLTK
jgi:holliday junction DNA helicase RuvB